MNNTFKKAFLLISIISLVFLVACSSDKTVEDTPEVELEETEEVMEETKEVELEEELPPITGKVTDLMFLGEWKNTEAYGMESHIIFEIDNDGQFINEETTFTFEYTLVSQKLLRLDATSGEILTDSTLQKFTNKGGAPGNKDFKFQDIKHLTIDDVVWEKVDTTIAENSYKDKIKPCTTC